MDWILSGVILTSFFILGASRLSAGIRAVAVQGLLLSLLPLMVRGMVTDWHSLVLFLGTLIAKAIVIPALLFRSIREAAIRRETEPVTSRHISLLVGGILMIAAFSWKLPGSFQPQSPLIVPASLTTILLGFMLLVTRTKAVTQVIGFLVLENGVFLFGMTVVAEFPMTVEMGVLLDLLVGVFVMGIMIHHINRSFDHIDTARLSTSKDIE